ncbi:TPA: bifunctional adenosylcobinamide kinase/adenosylcobinamide-phosphate guanylyltransferase [Candidatus Latescibacteria bacterium]|nr:bifunctional adenosylcobinamide kinase/adenosylcobinamide-phosphate guanylyltransferase [Candidatus Latescibacterota bacterium]|tara:strand:- start:50 stop:586 length:537 start_codon:yes stop_codon:yes gene_type:complete
MGHITLVTGGARSGKSRHAQDLAESVEGPRTYIATCPALDVEMRSRIERHRNDREDRGWTTIEEETDLIGVLNRTEGTVLIDCLTLWISNLMYHAEQTEASVSEDGIAQKAGLLCEAARARSGATILVTNEVGLGVVPAHASGRLFRDLAGRCNQVVAASASQVVMLVSGIPMTLKDD